MINYWKRIVNDEWISTGGGFDYYITFYRNTKNPLKQIELFQETDNGKKRLASWMVNIGTLFEKTSDVYEFIQGDYFKVESFALKKDAIRFINKMIKQFPKGEYEALK
jgi:hypothetical protein